jgi:hypothetical protein
MGSEAPLRYVAAADGVRDLPEIVRVEECENDTTRGKPG